MCLVPTRQNGIWHILYFSNVFGLGALVAYSIVYFVSIAEFHTALIVKGVWFVMEVQRILNGGATHSQFGTNLFGKTPTAYYVAPRRATVVLMRRRCEAMSLGRAIPFHLERRFLHAYLLAIGMMSELRNTNAATGIRLHFSREKSFCERECNMEQGTGAFETKLRRHADTAP